MNEAPAINAIRDSHPLVLPPSLKLCIPVALLDVLIVCHGGNSGDARLDAVGEYLAHMCAECLFNDEPRDVVGRIDHSVPFASTGSAYRLYFYRFLAPGLGNQTLHICDRLLKYVTENGYPNF